MSYGQQELFAREPWSAADTHFDSTLATGARALPKVCPLENAKRPLNGSAALTPNRFCEARTLFTFILIASILPGLHLKPPRDTDSFMKGKLCLLERFSSPTDPERLQSLVCTLCRHGRLYLSEVISVKSSHNSTQGVRESEVATAALITPP